MISRREFLQNASAAMALAGAIHPLLGWASEDVSVPGKEGMIVRSFRFLDLEMPPEYANSFITPVPHFFVRNHMHEPATLDASTWRLTVSGEVKKPLVFSLAELEKLESHAVVNALECAGNGRGLVDPHVS